MISIKLLAKSTFKIIIVLEIFLFCKNENEGGRGLGLLLDKNIIYGI